MSSGVDEVLQLVQRLIILPDRGYLCFQALCDHLPRLSSAWLTYRRWQEHVGPMPDFVAAALHILLGRFWLGSVAFRP